MESNKDEALRCLAIAQRHRDSGNAPSALKFCQKSINLFSTPEAAKLLASLDADSARPASSNGSAGGSPFTSGTETHASAAGAKHRHTASSASGTPSGSGGNKREFTPEQHAVVKRVRACKVTEYYEILDVQRDCEETHVKKAYRKVCLAHNCSFSMFSNIVIYSWHWHYILIRMVLLMLTKLSKVSLLLKVYLA